MTNSMREIGRRLRALETRPPYEAEDYTPEQWDHLADGDLDALSKLPANADGSWAFDQWTEEQHALARHIYRKAMRAEA